jgi:hypothetical protein
MRNNLYVSSIFILSAGLMFCFTNCSKVSTASSRDSGAAFDASGKGAGDSGTGGTGVGNPKPTLRIDKVKLSDEESRIRVTIDNVYLCLKYLRLYKLDMAITEHRVQAATPFVINLNKKDSIKMNLEGTEIGAYEIEAGSYNMSEFVLDSSCSNGKSIEVTGESSHVNSKKRIVIRLRGNIDVDSSTTDLIYDFSYILKRLAHASKKGNLDYVFQPDTGTSLAVFTINLDRNENREENEK